MKILIFWAVMACTAFAGKSGFCYKIEPMGDGCGGCTNKPAWTVKYKEGLFWRDSYRWLPYTKNLQDVLIVYSIQQGRDYVKQIEAVGGPLKWNAIQKAYAADWKNQQDRRAAAEAKAASKLLPKKPVKQETVEICPL